MKYKFKSNDAGYVEGWWETYSDPKVVDQGSAEKAANALIQSYNDTLQHNDRPRKLLEVVFLGKVKDEVQRHATEPHEWGKLSLVTERGGYDRMRCGKCGITGKRYGINGVRIDSEYKAKAFMRCDTARALIEKRTKTNG